MKVKFKNLCCIHDWFMIGLCIDFYEDIDNYGHTFVAEIDLWKIRLGFEVNFSRE